MLSKVYHGHSFYHACRYIVTKQDAKILYAEGVRSHDFKLMADDFMMQQQLRPAKEKACFHSSLSFYPGEVVDDEIMVKIAKEYLKRLNITDTQFAITKHTDRRHLHLHIIANLVNNKGKAISDSYLGLRGKKIAQAITDEYKLKTSLKKNLALTNFEALRGQDAKRYAIYIAIKELLPQCRTIEELERKLKQYRIETQYKFKSGTKEVQGISFKLGNNIFKGSSIDRSFSYNNLKKLLGVSEKEALQVDISKNKLKINAGERKNSNTDSAIRNDQNLSDKILSHETAKLIDALMRPEQNNEQIAGELLKEQRKKKKKGQRFRRGLH